MVLLPQPSEMLLGGLDGAPDRGPDIYIFSFFFAGGGGANRHRIDPQPVRLSLLGSEIWRVRLTWWKIFCRTFYGPGHEAHSSIRTRLPKAGYMHP